MSYLYEALEKPTRLYIKQCPHCGLKYFGKSTRQDIKKYEGSGTRWTRHLKKHKVKPLHLWNSDWYYDTSISRFALKFSHMNKIVESKLWANLIPEDGLEGSWDHVNTNRLNTYPHKPELDIWKLDNLARPALKRLFETDPIFRENLKNNVSAGVKRHYKENGSHWEGRFHSEETKNKIGEKNAISQKGNRNSQYGTMWITNGYNNRKIKKNDVIPDGWYKGRLTK